jgi:arylsulfatase A-like enzyme
MVEDDDFRPSNLNLAGSWVMLKDKDELIESLVHKLHHRPKYELYDLYKDPHELINLAEEKSYQPIFKRLKSALENKLSSIGDSDPVATERSYLLQSK